MVRENDIPLKSFTFEFYDADVANGFPEYTRLFAFNENNSTIYQLEQHADKCGETGKHVRDQVFKIVRHKLDEIENKMNGQPVPMEPGTIEEPFRRIKELFCDLTEQAQWVDWKPNDDLITIADFLKNSQDVAPDYLCDMLSIPNTSTFGAAADKVLMEMTGKTK